MKVTLLNKEDAKRFFEIWGKFSCVCYDTDEKYAERVGRSCLESHHFSGSRAFSFIFKIEGMSRVCSHQVVRHSVGVTINQRSQRYCNEGNFGYVTPKSISENKEAKMIYEKCMQDISEAYKKLSQILEEGNLKGEKLNQDVRYILPNACETEMTIGFTMEALAHFCNERLCTTAQEEIRILANMMRKEVLEILPELESVLCTKCDSLGYCPEQKKRSCGRRPCR